ncbi:MAG TPA: DUF4118 domain-containing protein, partial [Desulfosarcina sp.]|nr:DUF4118 domain-containing protein [Desulfosarcina sp.]
MTTHIMKAGIVVFLLLAVAVIHHLPLGGFMGIHILHRELFFFPIVLAGLWFGLKVSLAAAVVASLLYAHLFTGNAQLQSASVVTVALQVAGFHLMALLTGWMVDHQRRQRRERDALNETFGRDVSKEVRDEILAGRVYLKGELKDVTVLFADLRYFTGLVE